MLNERSGPPPLTGVTESPWLWPKCRSPFPGPASPFGVCDLENSDPLRPALDSVSEWRQESSWGLPAPCGWRAARQIPGTDAWVIVSHMCVQSCTCKSCANAPPPPSGPSPLGGCQDAALERWPTGVLPCVPAVVAVHLCHGAVCKEPDPGLWVTRASRAPSSCDILGGDPCPSHSGCGI